MHGAVCPSYTLNTIYWWPGDTNEPGHQQPWYWPSFPGISRPYHQKVQRFSRHCNGMIITLTTYHNRRSRLSIWPSFTPEDKVVGLTTSVYSGWNRFIVHIFCDALAPACTVGSSSDIMLTIHEWTFLSPSGWMPSLLDLPGPLLLTWCNFDPSMDK